MTDLIRCLMLWRLVGEAFPEQRSGRGESKLSVGLRGRRRDDRISSKSEPLPNLKLKLQPMVHGKRLEARIR